MKSIHSLADLGDGPPYLKKEEITERRKAGRASKTTHPPLAQGLDPSLFGAE